MVIFSSGSLIAVFAILQHVTSIMACVPPDRPLSGTNNIQDALRAGGPGAVVQLCPNSGYYIQSPISYTAPNQEISTAGYPTNNSRAQIIYFRAPQPGTVINAVNRNGAKLLNVQISAPAGGNRSLILMGGTAANQTISQVVATSNQAFFGMDIESGCTGLKVTNNTLLFSTVSGGGRVLASGIRLACNTALVQYNNISGWSDAGILVYGYPGTVGSQILDNQFTSPTAQISNGAIAVVSGGQYTNLQVARNQIIGRGSGLFNIGIAVGARVWRTNSAYPARGPTYILNNTFVGNIGFSIVVNSWEAGLYISRNDVTAVTTPSSAFAYASECPLQQVQSSFNANQQLIVYRPNLAGPNGLQAGFVNITQDANNWLCLKDRNSKSYGLGGLSVTAVNQGLITELVSPGDLSLRQRVYLQGDGNLVGYSINSNGASSVLWATNRFSKNCGSDNSRCSLNFQGDGNLVEYDSLGVVWASNTVNQGATFELLNTYPYCQIKDSSGTAIWNYVAVRPTS